MSKKDIITINGMRFEKTHLIPNSQGVYDKNACAECHLNLPWVDYGKEDPCLKVVCNHHAVWYIIGGVEKLKPKREEDESK